MKVERINKNHLVNNLVEAYLKANPGKLFIRYITFDFYILIAVRIELGQFVHQILAKSMLN